MGNNLQEGMLCWPGETDIRQVFCRLESDGQCVHVCLLDDVNLGDLRLPLKSQVPGDCQQLQFHPEPKPDRQNLLWRKKRQRGKFPAVCLKLNENLIEHYTGKRLVIDHATTNNIA